MKNEDIIKSITKKYKKEIWSRFNKAIKEFKLIEENDKIMVCISGGKDSMLLAKCLEELKRHSYYHFDLEYVVMNPGYKQENLALLKSNLEKLNIKATIFDSDIFAVCDKISKENPCYLCARMRRGWLYSKAKELGCNKIALGHHFDDVIETILMSTLYAGQFKTMLPKLKSTNVEGMQLIRPLYYVKEQDIIRWRDRNGLDFIQCACKFTEDISKAKDKNEVSKRQEMKELISNLRKKYDKIDINIFNSAKDVNLESLISYHLKDEKHSFLDDF